MIEKVKIAQESHLELLLYEQLEQAGMLEPGGLVEGIEWHRTIEGHETDFCLFDLKVIIEVQGGTAGFGRGRGSHAREPGYSTDRRFSNLLQTKGWWVLEFTAPLIHSNEALEFIRVELRKRQDTP